jgi:hypothetical protein
MGRDIESCQGVGMYIPRVVALKKVLSKTVNLVEVLEHLNCES